MSYRNIFIQSNSNISVKNNQLILSSDEQTRGVPLEDISSVLIDSRAVNIGSYALSKLSESGITVIITDEKHLPSGVLLPLVSHSRHFQILKLQIEKTKPFYKNLWREIVISKIRNQAKVLKICNKDYTKIEYLAETVKSGDTSNNEGIAAATYFRELFGGGFLRGDENDERNSFLNYGYAILRSTIAKQLVVYGFEPSLGIHHRNQLNSFNLADDIIEPFRPLIDLYVFSLGDDPIFGSKEKAGLLNLLNYDVLYDGKKYSVSYAIEQMVSELSAYYSNERIIMKLPEIIPLDIHEYE